MQKRAGGGNHGFQPPQIFVYYSVAGEAKDVAGTGIVSGTGTGTGVASGVKSGMGTGSGKFFSGIVGTDGVARFAGVAGGGRGVVAPVDKGSATTAGSDSGRVDETAGVSKG